jgi:hypothetical protein
MVLLFQRSGKMTKITDLKRFGKNKMTLYVPQTDVPLMDQDLQQLVVP